MISSDSIPRNTDDILALIRILPPEISRNIDAAGDLSQLTEIIMDIGRPAAARYNNAEVILSPDPVTYQQIDAVTQNIRGFDLDNRAGIERTLHRISAIRNRQHRIIGLTLRIGRALYGTTDLIQDILTTRKSILLLGRPGIGKTTMLREAARILSRDRRVIIVDTSNEIGGDGDIPHPAVGNARRLQVPRPDLQHEVMIEAVENHNPEVIIIDEIGRELEARAARTIAERGVQLIATAHGQTLTNLLMNPTLSDLIGGIRPVTLSDEEARRRQTQKIILERCAPPTFQILTEINSRDRVIIYHDVAEAVDALVRNIEHQPEQRTRTKNGQILFEKGPAPVLEDSHTANLPEPAVLPREQANILAIPPEPLAPRRPRPVPAPAAAPIRIYPHGISPADLNRAAAALSLSVRSVRDPEDADVLITLRSHYRQRPPQITRAEEHGTPVYVLRTNTPEALQSFLQHLHSPEA